MPTIPKREPKKQEYKRIYKAKNNNNQIFDLVYNTDTWRKLRLQKLTNQPLCELCELKKKLTLATCVHHVIYISTGRNKIEIKALGFDPNNLMSLCNECHKEIHSNI